MSSFCGISPKSIPALAPGESLNDKFKDGVLPDGLPDLENGLASESWVNNYVKSLEDRNFVPRPPKDITTLPSVPYNSPDTVDPMMTYVQRDNTFQDIVKAEYCHYEKRYLVSLDSFLQAVGGSSLQNEPANNVETRLKTTKELNKKLIILTQIVNGLSIYKYDTAKRYQTNINNINTTLQKRKDELQRQQEILNKENASLDVHRRMIDYTVEKNRANNNLLAIYGVLNIVALAMVFYVART